MNPERWRQIERLYHAALERGADERAAFLAEACGADDSLRGQVAALLAFEAEAEGFIEAPAFEVAAQALAAETGQTLAAGEKVGRYEILHRLGKGGMGEVYLAHDKSLGRDVAIKVLLPEFTCESERVHRFKLEAKAASALNHPNIITIYEIGADGDKIFIASEHIKGDTLRRLMQERKLTLAASVNIAEQLGAALAEAHEAGLIHRDIKPENVMVRADGLVKVLDFGLAKPTAANLAFETGSYVSTQQGVVMGSLNYMSPEQARGLEMDARTDLWSLGVVCYEMLAGRRPFTGATPTDTIVAIVEKEPPPLAECAPGVPAGIAAVVAKSLRKEKGERYQSARDWLADLRRSAQRLELSAAQPDEDDTAPLPGAPDATTTTLKLAVASQPHVVYSTSSAEYLVNQLRRHKLGFAVGALILLAALGLGVWFALLRPAGVKQIESIAVMPFTNESGNQEVEYMADGIAESLIGSLSQISQLNVKARSSVFRYKGKDVSALTLGRELGVQAVLYGRVVQRGEDLTLYLALVDAATENNLWSQQYNRPLSSLVALQSEIARDVSLHLPARLSDTDEQKVARSDTANAEAYKLYLQGRFHWNKRTPRDLQKAVGYFQQAVALDANYARAYAGLADAYNLAASFGSAPPREAMPRAKEAALQALSLNGQLAEPHVALGYIAEYYDYDLAQAERHFRRALELNPNYAPAHEFYGTLLSSLGRHQEAETEFRHALELEPLSLGTNRMYGEMLFFARRYDESIAQLKKTIELDENFASAHRSLARVYLKTGNHAGHVESFARHYDIIGEPDIAAQVRRNFATGDWKGYLQAMTGANRPTKYYFPFYAAFYYAELGDKDKALAELDQTFAERLYFIAWMKTDPCLDALRADPHFQELLRHAGL
jgi:serine/threonine-protein kinase